MNNERKEGGNKVERLRKGKEVFVKGINSFVFRVEKSRKANIRTSKQE